MPNTLSETLTSAFQELWFGLVQLVPAIIIALVIFLVGWAVGAVVGRVIERIVNSTGVNKQLKQTRLHDALQRADYRLNSGRFLGSIVKWFFIIVFLIAALDVLELTQIALFLQTIAFDFLPDLLVAVAILLFAGIIAEFVGNLVRGAAQSANLEDVAGLLSTATRAAVWIFATLAALAQIGIAETLVQTLFGGIVFAVSLGLALAFGLGGQDKARAYLNKVDRKAQQKTQGSQTQSGTSGGDPRSS